ncbi:L-serine ammonia-lyase [Roseomonas elaeocarpi]|uniref:L-serine dehydratase n=1 Tax=Roseomonas elaeocarpi TaxID=907779 RepID=A0ABV6JSJ4_9PROT
MISVFDLFKIGIGPSSSHTVGPMRAAAAFVLTLEEAGLLGAVTRVEAVLLGSLAWTGEGHATGPATILGLCAEAPDTVQPEVAAQLLHEALGEHRLHLGGTRVIRFDPATDLRHDRDTPPPKHPNTLVLRATDAAGATLLEQRWCSVGGGFVQPEAEVGATPIADTAPVPYPFTSGEELLAIGARTGLTVAAIIRRNELALRPEAEVSAHLRAVTAVMMNCIERGVRAEGHLPGRLRVRRRAAALRARLDAAAGRNDPALPAPPHAAMDRVSLYAIAVNEENAAGGRVVTAPTNGAAGVIPAVLRYYRDHCPGATPQGMEDFLLAATAIGTLCKLNASISGAEVGCQGEVGSACAMAAAGLAAALGGTNAQVENAAEIGMEHHLGMTCDPVGGLVQIPCIERNAFGAQKAITAASLALHGDGAHHVSLDQVINTMRRTGADMHSKYKETSQGGLAVSFPEC